MMHDHGCTCMHLQLSYCPVCGKVWCVACRAEWVRSWYGSGETTQVVTMTTSQPDCSVCSH